MALTFLTGKGGSVTSTEMLAQLYMWTANFPQQIFDITAFGNSGWRVKIAGLSDSNGSCGGFATEGTTGDNLAAGITGRSQIGASLTLKSSSTNYIQLTAIISNLRTGADVNDVCRVTFDWEGTGAPTVTWATS